MKITDTQLDAWVRFVHQGLKELEDEDRVSFVSQLGCLFCIHCGRDLENQREPCYRTRDD